MEIKLLNKWETANVKVSDRGLQAYINLDPVIVPKSFGRERQPFHKSNMNIVERLANHMMVPGHRGKRHILTSGKSGGKAATALKLTKDVLTKIEETVKKNPVEVIVKAIENAALREEITSYQVGGIIVRRAVITSPQRRVDLALRLMVQGAYQKAHQNPKGFVETLAKEILSAYNYDAQNSHAIREKERIEREAGGAR